MLRARHTVCCVAHEQREDLSVVCKICFRREIALLARAAQQSPRSRLYTITRARSTSCRTASLSPNLSHSRCSWLASSLSWERSA